MADIQTAATTSPDPPDPMNEEEKLKLHPKADKKNRIELRNGKPALCCGAKRPEKKGGGFCRSRAGAGTDHPGSGRCKYCGGCNTGPKTPEGKARSAKNSTIHGLYASVLDDDEADIYLDLAEAEKLDLEHEIYFWKAKILRYIKHYKNRYELKRGAISEDEDEAAAYVYYAGSMEDRALDRALNTLGRLVEKHARLKQDSGDDLLSSINKELQQASEGRVTVSWGGKAQSRADEKPAE